MFQGVRINVTLDESTIKCLLNGLYQGAKEKALKVVTGSDGNFYIESKELRIVIEINTANMLLAKVHIHNDKLCSELDEGALAKMGFASLLKDIMNELLSKYSPTAHSLSENIYAFGKTYKY